MTNEQVALLAAAAFWGGMRESNIEDVKRTAVKFVRFLQNPDTDEGVVETRG